MVEQTLQQMRPSRAKLVEVLNLENIILKKPGNSNDLRNGERISCQNL